MILTNNRTEREKGREISLKISTGIKKRDLKKLSPRLVKYTEYFSSSINNKRQHTQQDSANLKSNQKLHKTQLE